MILQETIEVKIKGYQYDLTPEILVFKTNIETDSLIKDVSLLLDGLPSLDGWSVDTEDIDNVLRVVTQGNILESDIVDLLVSQGYYCSVLDY